MPFLFAHVSADGTVDDLGGGITQANLDSIDIEPGEEEGITNEWEYCFTGLPPLSGGQVTIDGGKDAIAAITLETGNPDCSPLVQLGGQRIDNTDAQPGFHMLVY